MKFKQVRALLTALALVVGTALCVSTVTWAKSLNPEPVSIINEQGEIVESNIQSDRTLYLGSTVEQDTTESILTKLCTTSLIKANNLTAKDLNISLKSELVFDEEKNEYVESEKDVKDVMTINDDKITFSRTGFFLAEVSIKEEKSTVIFDVDEKVLAYADLNDWVVKNNTKNPDFSVDFDKTEIKDITYDDSEVKTGIDGEYVLTYTITDKEDKTFEKSVLVTVGDKKVVDELSEKGVWVASAKKTAGNTNKPVVKPEKPNKPDSNNGSNNSGNQNSNNGSNNQNNGNQDNNQHTHVWGEWQVKKAATCDKTGLEERFCTTCNKKEVRKTPALGHALTETIITEPTCGAAGSKEISCTREGCTYKDIVEIPATGNHTYGDWVIVKEATCTEDGQRTKTCTACGDVLEEVIKATGHTFSEWEVKTQAGCETEGLEERHCTNEGCTEVESKVIPALGHDLKEEIVKEPTCGTPGLKNVTCTRCDYKEENVEIPATGEHKFGEWIVTKEPSCGNAGEETRTCDVCGHTETRPIDPVAEHKWDEGIVTKEATCTEEGIKTFTCTVCGDTKTEVIPALGHDWSDWEIKDSTCGQEGEKTRHCQRTGCTATETEKIPPSENHNWNDGVVTKDATCTEQGEVTYTCKDCGHTKVEKTPALGHDLKEVILKQPTCSEAGLKAMVCQRPGCDHRENEVSIPATGNHTFGDWTITKQPSCGVAGERTHTCTVCGKVESETLPALEHHWGNGVVTKQPTCTEMGKKTYTCEHCGDKKSEDIGLIDHIWETLYDIIHHPGETVYEEKYVCNQCNAQFDTGKEAVKHVAGTPCVNYSLKRVPVTKPGWDEKVPVGHKCTVCGKEERY